MATTIQKPELLVVVGPTASGKTDLSLKIAKQFNGEIIAADSRTIYIGMDVGTSKPTKKEQTEVPHWGLDLIEPGETFSAYQFKNYAEEKIKDIQQRGRLPILVGGTGLYIDSVLFDFKFGEAADPDARQKLESLSLVQLQNTIKEQDLAMPENYKNRRHLIRTIERQGRTGTMGSIKDNSIVIGLLPGPEVLKNRINKRAEAIFEAGVIKETNGLVDKYGEDSLLDTGGIVYKICLNVIQGLIGTEEAIEQFQKVDWQYARRQRTWFKRNKYINWYESPDRAYQSIVAIMNN
jgi:tRNA dimethylallyltransferase